MKQDLNHKSICPKCSTTLSIYSARPTSNSVDNYAICPKCRHEKLLYSHENFTFAGGSK